MEEIKFSCFDPSYFLKIFSGEVKIRDDDVTLGSSEKSCFSLSNRLSSGEGFKLTWDKSDLPRMVGRFAETAVRRIKHMEKHSEKTDAKIRMWCLTYPSPPQKPVCRQSEEIEIWETAQMIPDRWIALESMMTRCLRHFFVLSNKFWQANMQAVNIFFFNELILFQKF